MQRRALAELGRGVLREAQAQPKPLVRRDELLHGDRLLADRCEVILPAFAWMDIQAVGEMKRWRVLDDHAGRAKLLSS